jgi:hypothetical protein
MVVGGTAERLGSKDIWVSRVRRKDLTPRLLPPLPRPLDADADADALHLSAPRPLATV